MRRVIVVLGSPNDDAGVLSRMARERLEAARREFVADASSLIVLTGGFGAHFNRTSVPHAKYARRHLPRIGKADLLPGVLTESILSDVRETALELPSRSRPPQVNERLPPVNDSASFKRNRPL